MNTMSTSRFIYGFHAITIRLRLAAEDIEELFVQADRQDARLRALVDTAQRAGCRVTPLAATRLDGMAGGARHQGVVARVSTRQKFLTVDDILAGLDTSTPALLLVLDGVTDPHNLGACLRVADAAGAHAVIAPKDRACGLSAAAIKVASGAADSVPYLMVTNLARSLRQMQEHGVLVIGADGAAQADMFSLAQTGPTAWVLGAEGSGLRRLTRQTCDVCARIPLSGVVESLNVSVAAGICLFETYRQRLQAATRVKT